MIDIDAGAADLEHDVADNATEDIAHIARHLHLGCHLAGNFRQAKTAYDRMQRVRTGLAKRLTEGMIDAFATRSGHLWLVVKLGRVDTLKAYRDSAHATGFGLFDDNIPAVLADHFRIVECVRRVALSSVVCENERLLCRKFNCGRVGVRSAFGPELFGAKDPVDRK